MTIKDKLIAILQAESANQISIKRYIEKKDTDAIKAICRRESKINGLLKEVVKEIIDEKGQM